VTYRWSVLDWPRSLRSLRSPGPGVHDPIGPRTESWAPAFWVGRASQTARPRQFRPAVAGRPSRGRDLHHQGGFPAACILSHTDAPLVLCEQVVFGIPLEACNPGRSPGQSPAPGTTSTRARVAAHHGGAPSAEAFPQNWPDLSIVFSAECLRRRSPRRPGGGICPPIWLPRSSRFTRQLAVLLVSLSRWQPHPFQPRPPVPRSTCKRVRVFQPSNGLSGRTRMVAVSATAPNDERARHGFGGPSALRSPAGCPAPRPSWPPRWRRRPYPYFRPGARIRPGPFHRAAAASRNGRHSFPGLRERTGRGRSDAHHDGL